MATIRPRSRTVNRLMRWADALYDRYAVDHDCRAMCAEVDDYGEWCECDPRDGAWSFFAQTVQRAARWAYFRWTDHLLIRTFVRWDSDMEDTKTPFLAMMTRQRNGGR